MAELVSLDEVKAALGVNDNTQDYPLSLFIKRASTAVRNWTERDFGTANETETRSYEYDGSGYLDIDDASAVTELSITYAGFTRPLTADDWRAQPYEGPVYTYIVMPGQYGSASSAMGFRYNLDVYALEGRVLTLPLTVDVTATFGWPEVPEDVKQAVIWTVASFKSNPAPTVSQSIEGFSQSVGSAPLEAIPVRAKELLAAYQKVKV